jgi:hypothetical protein
VGEQGDFRRTDFSRGMGESGMAIASLYTCARRRENSALPSRSQTLVGPAGRGTKAEASITLVRVSMIAVVMKGAVVSWQHGARDGARWPLRMLLELGQVGKCQRLV